MTCLCELCRSENPAPTWTEAHRLACEVRSILSMPLEDRRRFLRIVERERGQEATQRLKNALIAEHNRRKNTNN